MRPGCKLVAKTVVRNLQALTLRDQQSHRISIVVTVHRTHPCTFAAQFRLIPSQFEDSWLAAVP
jgi:hypothetical protein